MDYRIKAYANENVFEVKISKNSNWVSIADISNLEKEKSLELCQLVGSFFDFMPGHIAGRSLHQLPGWIWKRKDSFPQSLTFFGGSFHPWHDGHEACLKLFPNPESLLVLPDNNPWKDEVRDHCHWTFFKELALFHQETAISFYPGFLGMLEKNPTATWFIPATIREKSLLVGDDTFHGLSRWYEIERLLKFIKRIYIVPRVMEAKNYEDGYNFIHEVAPHVELVRLPNHPFEHVSSTKIRNGSI